jgi:type III secretory pathway component EscS
MDTPKTTPKDFFLWAGAMVALYASVFAFIALIFSYINYAFPDPLNFSSYVSDPYSGGIAYYMAMFIVLLPTCVVLLWLIRRDIVRDATRADVWVRRWMLYLVLFVAGVTVVGDLITLLYTFLSGNELTLPFLLKVLLVLAVSGAGFLHFLADMRGYWNANPGKSKMVGIAVLALGAVAVVSGFFIVGTPGQAREYRYDQNRISDLQTIQYQLVYFWQRKQVLPATLSELNDPIQNFTTPVDPKTGTAYEYTKSGQTSFSLCAVFSEDAPANTQTRASYEQKQVSPSDVWTYSKGRTCFTRTIDPALYPPLNKTIPR